ncbi:11330_t:CDS:2 [Paraglomus occultum]|uniref:11330_t:CDS:1 n=1 Tax=Paraglomus occultum TaxID=144539 RepID=A0A9N8WIT9_9GLOM|nr:11330_t:CDS:2 [Paraglomus occultum]
MAMTMEKTTSITVKEDDNALDKPKDLPPPKNEAPGSNIPPPGSPASPSISTVSATSPFPTTSPPTKTMSAPQSLITDPVKTVSSAQTSPIQSSPVQTSPTTPTASATTSTGNAVNTVSPQGTTHKTQAAFVNKLYTMVEDVSIQHLIAWAPSGDVFSVSNPTEFSKTVLPQYFKHNNWQSFVRQLNSMLTLYGEKYILLFFITVLSSAASND